MTLSLVAKALPVGTTEKVRFSVAGGATWCAANGTGGGSSSTAETSEQVKVTITSRDASTVAGSVDFASGGRIEFKAPTAKGAAQCCPKVTLQD